MTKEQFIEEHYGGGRYANLFQDGTMVALPCCCGVDVCKGWAALTNNPMLIDAHMELYSPKRKDDEKKT